MFSDKKLFQYFRIHYIIIRLYYRSEQVKWSLRKGKSLFGEESPSSAGHGGR